MVSDNDFVISAYEASQNTFTGVSNDIWSQIFGAVVDLDPQVADRALKLAVTEQ